MIEDKLLIWKFKRGSSDALSRIYKKYKNNLLKIAFGLLYYGREVIRKTKSNAQLKNEIYEFYRTMPIYE